MHLTARGRGWTEIALWALSGVGAIAFGAYLVDIIARDGGIAYDLHAYILAGRHALEGEPLYATVQISDPGAYRYAPTFAYLAIPLAIPPELIVTWVYRAACLACVRVLVGSWRAVGIALLFWPLQIELDSLNVTLPIAVLARMALRGSTAGAGATPATAALKYGTILLAPYIWLRDPRRRRALLIGVGRGGPRLRRARVPPAGRLGGLSRLARPAVGIREPRPVRWPAAHRARAIDARRLRAALRHLCRPDRDRGMAPMDLARLRRRRARGAHPMGRPTGAARRRPAPVVGGPGSAGARRASCGVRRPVRPRRG